MTGSFSTPSFLADIFASGGSQLQTYEKVILLGIRDAYQYHREMIAEEVYIDSKERLEKYYQEGLRFWHLHDRERAVYYLGGALYHLQDAWLGLSNNLPHEVFWAKILRSQRDVSPSAFRFELSKTPVEWVEEAERERRKLGSELQEYMKNSSTKRLSTQELEKISDELLQNCQVSGASLLLQFFFEAEANA